MISENLTSPEGEHNYCRPFFKQKNIQDRSPADVCEQTQEREPRYSSNISVSRNLFHESSEDNLERKKVKESVTRSVGRRKSKILVREDFVDELIDTVQNVNRSNFKSFSGKVKYRQTSISSNDNSDSDSSFEDEITRQTKLDILKRFVLGDEYPVVETKDKSDKNQNNKRKRSDDIVLKCNSQKVFKLKILNNQDDKVYSQAKVFENDGNAEVDERVDSEEEDWNILSSLHNQSVDNENFVDNETFHSAENKNDNNEVIDSSANMSLPNDSDTESVKNVEKISAEIDKSRIYEDYDYGEIEYLEDENDVDEQDASKENDVQMITEENSPEKNREIKGSEKIIDEESCEEINDDDCEVTNENEKDKEVITEDNEKEVITEENESDKEVITEENEHENENDKEQNNPDLCEKFSSDSVVNETDDNETEKDQLKDTNSFEVGEKIVNEVENQNINCEDKSVSNENINRNDSTDEPDVSINDKIGEDLNETNENESTNLNKEESLPPTGLPLLKVRTIETINESFTNSSNPLRTIKFDKLGSPPSKNKINKMLSIQELYTFLKSIVSDPWVVTKPEKDCIAISKIVICRHLKPELLVSLVISEAGFISINVKGNRLPRTHSVLRNFCVTGNVTITAIFNLIMSIDTYVVCPGWKKDEETHFNECGDLLRSKNCKLLIEKYLKVCVNCKRMSVHSNFLSFLDSSFVVKFDEVDKSLKSKESTQWFDDYHNHIKDKLNISPTHDIIFLNKYWSDVKRLFMFSLSFGAYSSCHYNTLLHKYKKLQVMVERWRNVFCDENYEKMTETQVYVEPNVPEESHPDDETLSKDSLVDKLRTFAKEIKVIRRVLKNRSSHINTIYLWSIRRRRKRVDGKTNLETKNLNEEEDSLP